ncbi:hypothetical protein EN866_19395 [Mesorhizobium sp. M2D.F.Ca.ET.223.01.1.1]|uniref:hypothetical protein n=1 Tax=unclassified Mesorhizobium TaxID=325217 RepID=UPI000FCABEDC|nr:MULTISPECIES: hypothetical protein [unclassified Mesorhizobium]TGP89326.1 hypothetical protein EN864_19405 [bacterium M00.F.Ca.ET.221.01.1.1]TGP94699.1 hypothetical protein EN865_15275 [bacterium M00.F.Ca.ET.222.01.1.1]RVD58887.1 hypothetical protein EN783_14720 [Mesorhizobium sp. M2D.F.Ca.ET.140.01.1.1]TGP27916.1 hypothetical protein EN875_033205 [Mesorhizobium sp. M2D.F.Ca.ET.232.01.1.1]TGP75867.1 hypothetical protein EN867_15275 [Mesorhizobium sp. M2D.F.Ca.ET.224.01.1.1]
MDAEQAKADWIAAENAWFDQFLAAKALREKADRAKAAWMKAYENENMKDTENEDHKTGL